MNASPSFYKPELDMLRFFAFFAVFVEHTVTYSVDYLVQRHVPLWVAKIGLSFAHAGMYGVDVFFVLSAYLITELLLREKQATGSLNVRAFYLRRILRIWPLYYFLIAVAVLISVLNPIHDFGARYVLPFLVLMGNWSFILFGTPSSIAVPLWSISVEEQFYLLWPPVVARLSRQQIIVTAAGLIGVANVSRFVAVAMHQNRVQLWMNTFAHLDSIAAGILLAVLLRGRVFSFGFRRRIAMLSLAVSCLAARAYFDFGITRGDKPLSPLGTLLGDPVVVLACAAILFGFIDLPFRSPALEYLGKISYGLYIYHLIGLSFIDTIDNVRRGGDPGPIHACVRLVFALGITIAISAVSYAVVEKPFLKLKRRFTYVSSRPA
jgi:peptidoglycan/LPS O-acetylase OafA/YrhL